jgi:hypothetical protein
MTFSDLSNYRAANVLAAGFAAPKIGNFESCMKPVFGPQTALSLSRMPAASSPPMVPSIIGISNYS